MEVQRAFPTFSIHFRQVLILLYTVGQLYWAIAMPTPSTSASSSDANYSTDVSVSSTASTCILLIGYYPTTTSYGRGNNNAIFINHHWPDIGKTFASHLSSSLISNGLRIGNIQTASIHIAIFSQNYAKSSDRLNELFFMLKSGVPIIPVFYDVKPSDLRCQVKYAPVVRMFRWTRVKNRALYCQDLRMLEEEKAIDSQTGQERPRYDSNTTMEWRQSLTQASGICGFERAAYDGDEGLLVHNVVKHVLSMFRIEEPEKPIRYHVFISHRGPDTKNTLASHLYHRLSDSGWRVFFDKEESRKGYRVNCEIKNAIKVASVHIAIFSTGYADSEWCNDELVLMLESEAVIIPVFIVKPTDMWNRVDGMNGVYAEALQILKEEKAVDPETRQEKLRYDSDTIEIWKEALMEVTSRDGFELETYDGYEGQLVDNVVEKVNTMMNQSKEQSWQQGAFLPGTLSSCGLCEELHPEASSCGLCEEQELDDQIFTEL